MRCDHADICVLPHVYNTFNLQAISDCFLIPLDEYINALPVPVHDDKGRRNRRKTYYDESDIDDAPRMRGWERIP